MTIEHIAIRTYDVERLRQFYCAHLGMIAEPAIIGSTGATIIFLHSPESGARIELMEQTAKQTAETAPTIGYVHLAFAIGSENAVHATIERLRTQGVHIVREPAYTPAGTLLAAIADPDGNTIEIVK